MQVSGSENAASASLKNDAFLEKLLETMRSLKETQERQGEKLEALMNSQRNTAANLSAEDTLKRILTAARVV